MQTLGALGSINALAGASTTALCAGFMVQWARLSLPVSTSQAIVGAEALAGQNDGWKLLPEKTVTKLHSRKIRGDLDRLYRHFQKQ